MAQPLSTTSVILRKNKALKTAYIRMSVLFSRGEFGSLGSLT
jgi:hypothetical protein